MTRRGIRHDRRGAAAMEFALIVVPLFMLVFGTIEFGRLLWTRDVVKQVASDGARCMGVLAEGCSSSDRVYSETRAKDYIVARAVGFSVPLTVAGVTLDHAAGCASPEGQGTSSEVTVEFTFNSAVGPIVEALAESRLLRVQSCFANQV